MLALALSILYACGGPPEAPPPTEGPTLLGPQDFAVANRESISAGPRVSGVLDAASRAVLRAEAAGTVEEIRAEVGQPVHKGDVLARIEAAAVSANRASAVSGAEAADQDVKVAERELARVKHLVEVGALAARDLELAESSLQAARARAKAARAQAAGAGEQLSGTVVRAPIDGVVSERSVSAGDVVAPGSPLFVVLDPSTLRLTGAVPASALGGLSVGASVRVSVQGQQTRVEGRVERVAPAVDPTTRQVPVIVSLPNSEGALVAGLFAEGQVAVMTHEGVVVPADALLASASTPTVLVVRDGKVAPAAVEIGLRDEAAERVEITSGVEAGETVLIGPARDVDVGTAVAVAPAGT